MNQPENAAEALHKVQAGVWHLEDEKLRREVEFKSQIRDERQR